MTKCFLIRSALCVLTALSFQSCQTTNPYTGEAQRSKAATGAIAGGLLGATIGALSGDDSSERRQKALQGAGLGVLVGGGVGAYMDRQEAELRRELQGTGVGIGRRADGIYLVMPGDVTFATGSAQIKGQFYPTLNSVAKVLAKYDKTHVGIDGHTDNVGGRQYNLGLSQNRASSVAAYLQGRRVASGRLKIAGRGFDQPIADNATAVGRQKNRRVTINLLPLNQ